MNSGKWHKKFHESNELNYGYMNQMNLIMDITTEQKLQLSMRRRLDTHWVEVLTEIMQNGKLIMKAL